MNPLAIKQQILSLMKRASTEVTTHDEDSIPQLARILPVGTTVYVAHIPRASLKEVVRTSVILESFGFKASPHIVARRLDSERTLTTSLAVMQDAGISRALLVAGDVRRPTGPFQSTLDIIESGLLGKYDIRHVGVAGHPEGHPAIGPAGLWDALTRKQAFADRTGTAVHIVTQFGFNPQAICDWSTNLCSRGLVLPVHVGIAGPTSLAKLVRFAVNCGVGASLQSVMMKMNAMSQFTRAATTPGEMLTGLIKGGAAGRIQTIQTPHFFTFGGVLSTARWIRSVASGAFEIQSDGKLVPAIEESRARTGSL